LVPKIDPTPELSRVLGETRPKNGVIFGSKCEIALGRDFGRILSQKFCKILKNGLENNFKSVPKVPYYWEIWLGFLKSPKMDDFKNTNQISQ